ncbi:MAG: endonuclease/exonuclease/phosphatase family protein [Bacillaceae bacterium]|nr:endonuclease/exonuclease/phosphatase family protein [Bacillaceae bacterium]
MPKKFIILLIVSVLAVWLIYFFHEKNKAKYTWKNYHDFFVTDEMITVTTYNVRYGKGLDNRVNIQRTIEVLRSLDSDIISLQEIERYSIRSKFKDQVQIIAKELEMNAVFYPSISYPGIYYGNAILSRFPIESTDRISFFSKRENRSAILSKINISEEQSIYVINTHLGLNEGERLAAIKKIYERLSQIEEPVILMGDLNSLPTKKEYQMWDSYLTKSNVGDPIQTYYSREWQIDYIFHSKEFVVSQTNVLKNDASDHYPVTAELSLQNNPLKFSTVSSRGPLLD